MAGVMMDDRMMRPRDGLSSLNVMFLDLLSRVSSLRNAFDSGRYDSAEMRDRFSLLFRSARRVVAQMEDVKSNDLCYTSHVQCTRFPNLCLGMKLVRCSCDIGTEITIRRTYLLDPDGTVLLAWHIFLAAGDNTFVPFACVLAAEDALRNLGVQEFSDLRYEFDLRVARVAPVSIIPNPDDVVVGYAIYVQPPEKVSVGELIAEVVSRYGFKSLADTRADIDDC